MEPALTDILCANCGLCCRGDFFGDVELRDDQEAAGLEAMGLEIEEGDEGPLLMQPCAALCGTRCGIYPHRPECCRTFECGLLQDVGEGRVSVARGREVIAGALRMRNEVERLLESLGQTERRLPLRERCGDAFSAEGGDLEDTTKNTESAKQDQLQEAMTAFEKTIRTNFLPDG